MIRIFATHRLEKEMGDHAEYVKRPFEIDPNETVKDLVKRILLYNRRPNFDVQSSSDDSIELKIAPQLNSEEVSLVEEHEKKNISQDVPF